MTDTTAAGPIGAREILQDHFGRIADQVDGVLDGVRDLAGDGDGAQEVLHWRPDPGANPIGWLLWHLTRVTDDHVAALAGEPQVWTGEGWSERFGLPFDDDAIGYGQSGDEVGRLRVTAELLRGYHRATQQLVARYLEQLDQAELARVVDEDWDPPVTAAVRLVSVVGDAVDHVGQAEYVLGMARRR